MARHLIFPPPPYQPMLQYVTLVLLSINQNMLQHVALYISSSPMNSP